MLSVSRLSIAPVRSLGLEHPEEIVVTETGVVEDRRFFLADDANRLVDRLVVGELVQIAAHTDPAASTLRLTFPDGRVVAAGALAGSVSGRNLATVGLEPIRLIALYRVTPPSTTLGQLRHPRHPERTLGPRASG